MSKESDEDFEKFCQEMGVNQGDINVAMGRRYDGKEVGGEDDREEAEPRKEAKSNGKETPEENGPNASA
jgi:hypothetical protein